MAMTLQVAKGGQTSLGGMGTYNDFQYEEVNRKETKTVVTVVGDKGDGKTTLCLGQLGEIYAFSFDNKTQSIKEGVYKSDSRIHVIDANKFLIESKEDIRDSSTKCYAYVMYCLKEIANKGGCDWIVIDGLKAFSAMAEMAMRKANGVKAMEGFSNRNLWKERNLFIRDFHRKALEISKRGVIYTTYFKLDEITTETGDIVIKKVPNYTDAVMMETDIVVAVHSERVNAKRIYLVDCLSSKRPDIMESGRIGDITNNIPQLWKEAAQ